MHVAKVSRNSPLQTSQLMMCTAREILLTATISTAQHSTAKPSPAQRSTAQHSTPDQILKLSVSLFLQTLLIFGQQASDVFRYEPEGAWICDLDIALCQDGCSCLKGVSGHNLQ